MKREEEIRQTAAAYILEMYGEINEDSDISEGFQEGAKWADKTNVNGKELLYVAQKTAERTKKEIISQACEWLLHQEEMIGISFEDDFIERFKKAMEL